MAKKQKFAVFDVDGTFFRSSLYYELVHEFIRRNEFAVEELKNFKDLEWQWRSNRSDETFNRFDLAMLDVFEAKLPKVSPDIYDEVVNLIIENHITNVFSFTSDLAKQLKAEGYKLIAISGSQVELVERFMTGHGFDICIGLVHERAGGAFTGQSKRVYNKKHTILQEIIDKEQLTYKGSVGVGDTAGDIAMMSLVERAIAFNPDKRLVQHAYDNKWEVVVERKGCVYNIPHESIALTGGEVHA